MNYLEQTMIEAKDYQLQSLIEQFNRFYREATTNTTSQILRDSVHAAKAECDKRGIPYT
jgi:hypothetical protein